MGIPVLSVSSKPIYEFGPFLLEPHARRLSRDGEPVPLGAPEFELLLLLVRSHGRVVEKREILETVWPDVEVEENNLTVRMSALRRALGETKENHPYIQTVPGRGYCLIAEVNELSTQTTTERVDNELPVLTESNNAHVVRDSFPRNASRRKWVLLAILVVGLLATVSLYVMLRWRTAGKSEAPAQSMNISRITQTGRVQWAALSPDGQNVAYAERDGELSSLWLQRAGTNNPLQLHPPAKLTYKDPSFSRDGHTLYYSKCDQGCLVYKMPVFGGVETALGLRADCRVTFSPDGKRMAYVRSSVEPTGLVTARLFVANAEGTGEQALNWQAGDSLYQGGAPAWSPDGKVIAFSINATKGGGRMKVIGFNVADQTESTLISGPWMNIRDVAWLPDGTGLIVNGRNEVPGTERGMQVWRVPLAGGEARRITNDLNNYASISLSVDGSTLIAVQWEATSGLWIASAENPSVPAQVTAGTLDRRDGNHGLSVAPDGRLIYVSDRGGKWDLWSIDADGTSIKQLTDASHRDLSPVVSPDGRYIVFQSCRNPNTDRTYNIWRVDADGRNPMQLTRGTYDSEPVFSPDGESVIYVAEDGHVPKLRRVPINGGDGVPLTDEFSQHPTFSPDGKMLVYYRMNQKQRDQRHLVFIPAQGGEPIKTLPAPKNFGAIMVWAPAGDSLWYRDSTLTSIWVFPVDGKPPTPLIKLRNQTLSTFTFSPDGRRLVYSSGPRLSDVVLITRFN